MELCCDELALTIDHDRTAPVLVRYGVGTAGRAESVLMLENGRVRFDGTLADFCTRPDGTTDDAESAFLRRMFAADPS